MRSATRWLEGMLRFARSRLARNIAIGVVAAFVVFTLVGFFVVPYLVSRYVTTELATSLKRTIKLGAVHFNPYTLDLNLDKIEVAERGQPQPFVQIAHLHADASWWSLFRLAPIISALEIDQPIIHVVRVGQQQFNFSDLMQSSPQKPKTGPTRFSLSNLRLRNGLIKFDDRVLDQHHTISNLQIGVPFIANLPADVNVYVQPLLEMVIDGGTPLLITGKALPFSSPPESILKVHLEQLELPRYVAYLPSQVPIQLPQGTLSCRLQVHFVNSPTTPEMRVTGTIALDRLDLRNRASVPLLALKHARADLADVEPMREFASLESMQIAGLNANLVLNHDGSSNLTPLTAGGPGQPTAATSATSSQSTSAEVILKSFDLSQSTVGITDNRGSHPAKLSLTDIHLALQNLATSGRTPATFKANAQLGSGRLAADGTLNYPQSRMAGNITLSQIALPPLQPLIHLGAPANIAAGQLNLHAQMNASYGSTFNLHVEPATVSLDNVRLASATGGEEPIQWKTLSAAIANFDLADHEANISAVKLDELHLLVRREQGGTINLLALMGVGGPPPSPAPANGAPGAPAASAAGKRPPGPAIRGEHLAISQTAQAIKHAAPKTPQPVVTPAARSRTGTAPPWKYQIASLSGRNNSVHLIDEAVPQPVDLSVAPFNFQLNGISNDLAKPIQVEADGTIRRGDFKITGTTAPRPLQANLHINTQRLDLAALDPYLTSQFNATIVRAELTMNASTELMQAGDHLRGHYNGDATLANFRVVDNVTSRPFARWKTATAKRIDAYYGERARIKVGELALDELQAGLILNANGHLNLRDIETNPKAAKGSLTRTNAARANHAAMQGAAARERAAQPEIEIGGFVMRRGALSYTDHFIRPNYSARLTDIGGRIGAFGTNSPTPAEVSLRGKVNQSAPVTVNGAVNPLAPMAYVNLRAKAEGIELPRLSTYSAKYTGYPIIKGTLTMNVHYLLEHQHLTAQNRILIDQLTFGPKVVSPNAINLPIRLAVDLLKNPQGQINLDVPVSGSLADPKFSLGGVILGVLKNIVIKAASAPFRLLAAAFGGGHQHLEQINFKPGFAKLTSESRGKLDTLAKALLNKPTLGLTISGHVDPAVDLEGLRHAKLERLVKQQKVKSLEADGEQVNPAQVEVGKAEYKKYLTRAYKAATFPKPRNFIGLEKSLPEDQMTKLMLDHISVSQPDLQRLAERRADVVRAYLSQQQVNPRRLFLEAPRLEAANEKAPRVELSLQ